MKKSILIFAFLGAFVATGQRNEMRKTEVRVEIDEMTGDTTERLNLSTLLLSPQSESSIGLFRVNDGQEYLYSFIYTKNWLFVEKILVVIDGKKFEFESKESKRETFPEAYISEKNFFVPTAEFLEAFKNAKEIKYRLAGKSYYLDLEIKEKKLLTINEYSL